MSSSSRFASRVAFALAALPFAACAAPETETAPAEPAPRIAIADPGVPGDPMGVTVHRLANGITVMLSENHEEPRVEAWITVRAGGAKDPADATGMAHYLEHMQFKGTPRIGTLDWAAEKPHLDRITQIYDELFATTDDAKRAELYAAIDAANQEASKHAVPNELDRLYDALGGQGLNAFTSNDQTSYTVNIPSNRLEQWAIVETERLREPVYRLFQTEIEAVYEEKNRGMDNAARVTNEALNLAMYPSHPYGTQTVLGHVEHLKNPSINKMYEYFRRWYAPGNLCVALSGDFDKSEVLAILDRTLGGLEARPFPEDPTWPIAPPKGVKRVEVKHKGEEEVQIAFLIPPERHPDHDALVLCDMMLANGRTGLIDVNLNQAQKVRAAGCSPRLFLESGYQLFNANPKPNQSLDELETLLLEQIELLKQGRFTEDDLAAVVTDFEIQKKRELESNRNRVAAMTEAFIERVPWETKVRAIERLKGVRKDAVVAAARKWFGGDYVVVRRLNAEPDLPKIPKPTFTPVAIDATRRTPWAAELIAMPAPEIAPKFVVKGVDVEEVPLRSGKLVYAPNPLNDVFDLTFSFPIGTDHEPKLALGLGLLDLGGAGQLDGVALKRKLYALGSTITAGAGRDESVVSVSGLDANLRATVDLLRAHFEQPTGVGQDDLAKMIQRLIAQRRAQKAAPPAIAAALGEFARRGPESAFLRQPRNEELATWKAEDLLAAAKSLWNYRRTVSYVGRIPSAQLAGIVDLPPVGATHDRLVDAPARRPVVWVKPGGNRVLFVNSKASQANVQIVAPDGTFDRTQVPSQRVFNEYMSGSMGAVVFQEIRESRALAYEAGTNYRTPEWKEDEQLMSGALGTQADKTVDALTVLFDLVRRMPAAQSRFDAAVRSIDLAYRSTRAGFRRVPSLWNTWTHQGLDGDPRPWNWEQVKAMKLDQLVAWARRFETMPFTVAITGPRDRIDVEKLKAFGTVEELQVDQLFAW